MILLELTRRRERSDRLRGSQQIESNGGGIELARLNRAEDAGELFVSVGTASGAIDREMRGEALSDTATSRLIDESIESILQMAAGDRDAVYGDGPARRLLYASRVFRAKRDRR